MEIKCFCVLVCFLSSGGWVQIKWYYNDTRRLVGSLVIMVGCRRRAYHLSQKQCWPKKVLALS